MKLQQLYLQPRHHRKGFGSRLLSHVEEVARRQGYRAVMLTVNKANQPAIDAYTKAGFIIRQAAVFDIGGGFVMDDYVMVKEVA
jgi:ribosomal protein S18 acetylase RimI-like enzyme